METVVSGELRHFHEKLTKIAKTNAGHHRFEKFFQPSLMNILWVLMDGERYDYDDPKLQKLLYINSTWFNTGHFGGGMVLAYPFLRLLFKEWTGYNVMNKVNDEIWGFIREIFQDRRSRKEYKSGATNFMDKFLQEIDKADGQSDLFTDDQFLVICYDLFQVGAETTSNTLAFGILYMLLYPDVQKKVQAELDQVYRKQEIASVTDKQNVPYTTATILEIIRLSNILPVPGPRKVTKDYNYNGYLIPKGSYLAFNTYSVMRDKKLFGKDVDRFRPERFFGPDGKINGLAEYIQMSWGAGRRSCIGDKLVQTTLLRNFSFSKPLGMHEPSTEPILLLRLMLSPKLFDAIITKRQ